MMKKYILSWLLSVPFVCAINAQTSNEGTLYIAEGTQFSTVESFDNLTTATFLNDGDTFIYSNFNNDGIVDFFQKTGLTRFIGFGSQAISGSQVSYLHNVYFNNSSSTIPFEISGDININGQADLYEGILDNDTFGGVITFNENASHINTSDYSHIDGAVNKIGKQAFTFPIGDGGYYRMGAISAPAGNTNEFEAKFFYDNSNDLYPHHLKAGIIEAIDHQEYWTINKMSNIKEDVLITLSWRDVTTPQTFIDAAAQDALTIVRWDVETNMWVNEGGAIDMGEQTVTTAISGYGVYTLGKVKVDVMLPGGLTVYNALTPNGDGVNDFFLIDVPNDGSVWDLNVQVFNRWGVKVFQTTNYGENGNVFDGFSNGRLTVNDSQQLPTGTYYYILDYQYGDATDNKRHKQSGFLYISGN